MFEYSGQFPQVDEAEKEFALIKEFLRRYFILQLLFGATLSGENL